MRHISEIVKHPANVMRLTTPTQTGSRVDEFTEQDRLVVNEAFTRLVVIYPAWRNAVDGDALQWSKRYKRELALALIAAGISSVEQVEVGIRAACSGGTDFLPNPGKFAQDCKPPSVPYHREFKDPTDAERRQLEQKVSSPERRRAEIAQLKAIVAANST